MAYTLFGNGIPDPEGICFVSTPSHGYIRLSLERWESMPKVLLTETSFYSGGTHFEEDVEWARVALAFPEYFLGDEYKAAERIISHYHPEIYAEWLKQGKPTHTHKERRII